MQQKQNSSTKDCPKCKAPMKKGSMYRSGNSKFVAWSCEGCTYKTTECLGVD